MKSPTTLVCLCISFLLSFVVNAQEFEWAIQFGGDSVIYNKSLDVDLHNHTLVTGSFTKSVDFDPGPDEYVLTADSSRDIYIAKYDQNGGLIWANSMGGDQMEEGLDIKVDLFGNVYTTGFIRDTIELTTIDEDIELISNGARDIFLTKHNSDGELLWAKHYGGSLNDEAYSLALDHVGNIILVGSFYGEVIFDNLHENATLTSLGSYDGFILKLDSDGNFKWVKSFAGTDIVRIRSVITDSENNILTTGTFRDSFDFDPGISEYILKSNGANDIFFCKLTAQGSFEWANSIGGASHDKATSIAVDSDNKCVITGAFRNQIDFDPGPSTFLMNADTGSDAFIVMFDANGKFVWAKQIGNTSWVEGLSTTVDNTDHIYVSGMFAGTADFDPGPNTVELEAQSGTSLSSFCLKLDQVGHYIWAGSLGGSGASSLVVDAFDQIFMSGYFLYKGDFDPSEEEFEMFADGVTSGFLVKLNQGFSTENLEFNGDEAKFEIYPNPSFSEINFKFDGTYQHIKIEVYNAQGQLVENMTYTNTAPARILIPGHSGLYQVKIVLDHKVECWRKVIKL